MSRTATMQNEKQRRKHFEERAADQGRDSLCLISARKTENRQAGRHVALGVASRYEYLSQGEIAPGKALTAVSWQSSKPRELQAPRRQVQITRRGLPDIQSEVLRDFPSAPKAQAALFVSLTRSVRSWGEPHRIGSHSRKTIKGRAPENYSRSIL
jgi:hypothetical protein